MTTHLTTYTRPGTLSLLAAFGAMTLFSANTAKAQDAPPVNTGNVSLTAGADVVTEYWFRGIGQENSGLIVQPYFDVSFGLYDTDDLTLTGSVGQWNSLQDNNTESNGQGVWYESDFYAGVTADMDIYSLGVTYINLYNPAGGGIFAEEIDVSLGIDDSSLWDGDFALNPSALLAIETDGGSDAGSKKGTYLQLGIEPGFDDVCGSDSVTVNMTIPVTVGLSLDNYYEDGMGNDDTFGFLDVGAVFSTPLDNLIPADNGAWTASAGIHVIFLGDSAENISGVFGTGQDSTHVYGTFGVEMAY